MNGLPSCVWLKQWFSYLQPNDSFVSDSKENTENYACLASILLYVYTYIILSAKDTARETPTNTTSPQASATLTYVGGKLTPKDLYAVAIWIRSRLSFSLPRLALPRSSCLKPTSLCNGLRNSDR